MPFYNAYIPPDDDMAGDPAAVLSRAVVLKDGFSFAAFVFTGLWLLSKKLWLAFLAFAVIYGALLVLQQDLGLSAVALVIAQFALGLFLGLEAHHLWGCKLVANGWTHADVVEARNQDEAERRFFERALSGQADIRQANMSGSASLPQGTAFPVMPVLSTHPRPTAHASIGMFPEAKLR